MSRPISPRFEITVLKNKDVSDSAQVPATDAEIKFYRQGATVCSAFTLQPGQSAAQVQVYDIGQVVPNDTVLVNGGAVALAVVSIAGGATLVISNNNAFAVDLPIGTRLVPSNDRPSVYSDPLATQSLGSTISVDGTTARASAYLSRDRVDYQVAISGQASRWYLDGAGVLGRSDRRWNDLRDFGGNLQAAIDALPADGGIVFIPRGVWTVASGVIIEKPYVTLLGEQTGSVLKAQTPNGYDLITVKRQDFQARDLTIDGAATTFDPSGKSCLVLAGAGVSGHSVRGASLWNVYIQGGARYALWLRDADEFHWHQSMIVFNPGTGVRAERVAQGGRGIRFFGGEVGQNGRRGIEAAGLSGLLVFHCVIEGNRMPAGENDGAGLDAQDCTGVAIRYCDFEDARNGTANSTSQFLALRSCPSSVVDTCWFYGHKDADGRPFRGAKFIASPASRLTSCGCQNITEHLATFDSNSTDCLEWGSYDFEAIEGDYPRLQVLSPRFIGMSSHAISAPAHPTSATLPPPSSGRGAIVWVDSPDPGDSHLQVWDGNVWRNATLS